MQLTANTILKGKMLKAFIFEIKNLMKMSSTSVSIQNFKGGHSTIW